MHWKESHWEPGRVSCWGNQKANETEPLMAWQRASRMASRMALQRASRMALQRASRMAWTKDFLKVNLSLAALLDYPFPQLLERKSHSEL